MSQQLERFDAWIAEGGPSALIIKEYLQPAAGPGEVIFPPTFATEGYIIDGEGENSVCLLDTVGSQANRIEPLFKMAEYRDLTPQVEIRVKERVLNLLDLGHRAADAVARSTSLAPEFQAAFSSYDSGDAGPLAKVAPTTLLFGAWDSRGTQVKVPRAIDSTIRAFHVIKLVRGAQYFAALENEEIEELLNLEIAKQRDALSVDGFLDAPSKTLGGVIVKGDIVRTTILNLTVLRTLGGTTELRRYILGLALIAALSPGELFLRQGCLLVRDPERALTQTVVFRDGRREEATHSASDAVTYCRAAAQSFGVGGDRSVEFDPKAAKALLEKSAEKKAKKGKKE